MSSSSRTPPSVSFLGFTSAFCSLGYGFHSSKESGIIVVIPPQRIYQKSIPRGAEKGFYYYSTGQPPFFEPIAILVENEDDSIKVYLKFIENLNRKVDNPQEKVGYTADEGTIAEIFFEKLATQLYAAQKWKYLYKGSKN